VARARESRPHCSFTEFAIPETELLQLAESDSTINWLLTGEWQYSLESEGQVRFLVFTRVAGFNSTTDKIITAKSPCHSR
jgi:hypothetical protein